VKTAQEKGPQIVSIVGRQGGGKTTLIEALLPILVQQGLRVGTAKDAPHEEAFDDAGSDSARQRAAGAERTLLLGKGERLLTWRSSGDEEIDREIRRLFAGFDLVLVEGLKRGPFPKVEVWRAGCEPPLAWELPVLAVVTDADVALPPGTPRLSPADPGRVADFLLAPGTRS
jgi:molybdopterin-guanine dinucleotide biosynthesis protein B